MALDSDVGEAAKSNFTYLVTAAASLFGASLAVVGVLLSLENQRNVEAERLFREFEAARALLPNALSQINEICRTAMQLSVVFRDQWDELGEEEFRLKSSELLVLPENIHALFQTLISTSHEKDLTVHLSGILREHQIFYSRWKAEFSHLSGQPKQSPAYRDVRERTVSWAYLNAIAASMLNFARRDTEQFEPVVGSDEIRGALSIALGGEYEVYSDEIAMYARTYQRRFQGKHPGHF